MARDGMPSVFVVDTHETRPPVPPRLGKEKKQSATAQSLLFFLVILALFGMIIEAVFIYHLYQSKYPPSASFSKLSDDTHPTDSSADEMLPSKPVAHLTDGQDAHSDTHVMAWSMIAEPVIYEMVYDKNKHQLIIQKEGFYYIYSKVYFSESSVFYHSVEMQTEKYPGKSIRLLQSRQYSPRKEKGPNSFSNSFLGGVFHLYKNDAIYVKISDTTQIIRHKAYENVFGAFML